MKYGQWTYATYATGQSTRTGLTDLFRLETDRCMNIICTFVVRNVSDQIKDFETNFIYCYLNSMYFRLVGSLPAHLYSVAKTT